MSSDDLAYYQQRAETERGRAVQAPTPEIAAVHEKLATLYIDLVKQGGLGGTAQDLSPAAHLSLQER